MTMQKILLVDDEALILYSLSKTLRHCGSEVTTVTNGTDALSEIQRNSYDICFLDVQLPDANGLDLMKTIRNDSPSTSKRGCVPQEWASYSSLNQAGGGVV